MSLAQEDLQQIQDLFKKLIAETPEALNANVRYELDLRERTIRVEEELKHQRELMLEGFKQRGKRIEEADRRYEEIGCRLDWHMFLVLGSMVLCAVFEVMYLNEA